MDRPPEDDRVVSEEDDVVLVIERGLDERLDGVLLDVDRNDPERLVLDLV